MNLKEKRLSTKESDLFAAYSHSSNYKGSPGAFYKSYFLKQAWFFFHKVTVPTLHASLCQLSQISLRGKYKDHSLK